MEVHTTGLMQNAKRVIALNRLLPYQADTVSVLLQGTRELNDSINNTLEEIQSQQSSAGQLGPEKTASLLVNHLCMRRNKRCLLAYHKVRTDKIDEALWSGKDILEDQQSQQKQQAGEGADSGAEGSNNLSPEEEEYTRQYGELLAAYKGQWTDIDLTGSLEPPKDLFVDVRVLKDAGEIMTEYG
ncbi:hypothetical protein K402DRAFT_402052 [Aulographum hederae CBS 113979]|uniref:DNA replication complex GINS protein PSF1 n=1 Tax=Aulographum hederae CBS 113979 TaxID=1176131 RepID=A0A6G1H8M0_9PEZI|nr:hypothetical protein K402DRAFT_402052 [Aulographum hederae CBS 113979]